jgi:hypothetical protein
MSFRALSLRTLLAVGLATLPGLRAGTPAAAPAPERHCARPVPVPVLKAQPALSSLHFQPLSDHEAKETAVLDGSVALTITHWGCQDLMLTFALESKGMPDFTKNVPAGYREAASQIRRLIALKAKTGFNLEKAAAVLEAEAKKDKGIAYFHPISIPGTKMDKITVQGSSKGKTGNRLVFEFLRVLPRKKHVKAKRK